MQAHFLLNAETDFWLPLYYFQRKPYFQPAFFVPHTNLAMVAVDADGELVAGAVLEAETGAVYIPGAD